MDKLKLYRSFCNSISSSTPIARPQTGSICAQCLRRSPFKPPVLRRQQRRYQSSNPADVDPTFRSVVDNPPTLVRAGRRHNKAGLALLAAIPLTAFVLGCWQVQRLGWKTDLIARFEDRLVRDPLPLPPQIDPDAVKDFDYRRVVARGRFVHEKEMLIGPRLHDGKDGYLVITPLERSMDFAGVTGNTTILICRGWISKEHAEQSTRTESLPAGIVEVQGLLREPWKKNMFTPANHPERGIFHFPDVAEMAAYTDSQPVWIEETMSPDLIMAYDRESKGIPIGRAPEVNLRNNHAQYIFTWFSLSAATTVMLWMVLKGRSRFSRPGMRVRKNTGW
ncbi:SURF-family protein [Polychaeton citri CBS 116435]|uniref:SURF1-like protein n=1 Tax=Polychaeton citri CBS 116435 TaxID=1314669 RepID=A0A9P4QDY5_9PEZI|nr:SURF-family protein [Polychaeton citri CBS 116435]